MIETVHYPAPSRVMRVILLAVMLVCGAVADADESSNALWPTPSFEILTGNQAGILAANPAQRTPGGWFWVQPLPAGVYAFQEPGHAEQVNSFLILGEERDLLYDTGMGIASIRSALDFIREHEALGTRELIVVNSHGHLDHIGGNIEFDAVHVFEDPVTIGRLTRGMPAGNMTDYYGALTPPPAPPSGFDPATHVVAPTPKERIRFLQEGQRIDLGGRILEVMRTSSHTPADVVLYDAASQSLFTGDAFTPVTFLVSDLVQFEMDVQRFAALSVRHHFNTHGPALIDPSWRARTLKAARLINAGEIKPQTINLLGVELPNYANGDVDNIVDARQLLEALP